MYVGSKSNNPDTAIFKLASLEVLTVSEFVCILGTFLSLSVIRPITHDEKAFFKNEIMQNI